jgi:hypothetical protein
VSNSFDMGDWEPDQRVEAEIGNTRAFLWIVPAKVNGEWVFTESGGRSRFNVVLDQKYQELRSTPATAARWGVQGGRVNGSEIEVTVLAGDGSAMQLKGRVLDGIIEVETSRARYEGRRGE